ncbi:PD-(D/E)XK nuclease family protein [Ornithobacterium rhinotracheale]|uniref:PD-(D/E)XK nuclease family protein n=1 Tax=Ornithobacterium rhinotracheale TaxID=28251 RepID=UPI00129CD2EE|nr:PD-(D/E)XK nuclease family protein [Ornithobacterium rhinotracheale]MRJ10265.1 PD-(D/E)XK nuclease family protein [Ornithobacterium rhinotracheale]
MRTFLQQVVEDLMAQNLKFSKTVLVVPGNRPKAFLRKTFVESGFSGILPEILSVEELLKQISGLQLVSGLELLFTAFSVYQRQAEARSIEEFLKWAPTLLKDFDDIDASLANPKEVFDFMVSDERIKAWGEELEIGSREVIDQNLGFWVMAKVLYRDLKEELLQNGVAYRGFMASIAAEQMKDFLAKDRRNYHFIGFNAFTKAEQKIVETLVEENRAKCYWDTDAYYMQDTKQEAGNFLRAYKASGKFGAFNWEKDYFKDDKKIEIVAAAKQIGIAKFVGEKLKNLTPEERQETAIVLADEQLLPAILNALPEEVKKINITMGLPLQSVPLSSFFQALLEAYANQEKFNSFGKFYYKDVLKIIENPNFQAYFLDSAKNIKKDILENNKIFISREELLAQTEKLFVPLFEGFTQPLDFAKGMVDWIEYFCASVKSSDIEQEYFFRFKNIFQQLVQLFEKYGIITNFKIFKQLYQQILRTETLSFLGEPLVGLQLLGVLETRLLDFKHIIFTSVNEGVFPLGRQENTAIPFEYRQRFGLNTFLENDAIYAYHFYRLIQRCESATFLYNTDSDGMGKGEPSRFLLQLELESPHAIQQKLARVENEPEKAEPLVVEKTPAVMQALNQWKNKISPSSLGAYLYDNLGFYERYVLKIKEEREVEETANFQTLGTAVHDTLESLYTPFLGKALTQENFKTMREKLERTLKQKFNEILLKDQQLQGKNIIIYNVAKEMVENVLRKDELTAKNNRLIIMELERDFSASMTLNSGREINFFGKIDRVESLNGMIRVIDYKTGGLQDNELKFSERTWLNFAKDHNSTKAIQLLIYCYMYLTEHPNQRVAAGIYPLRFFTKEIQLLNIVGNEEFNSENIKEGLLAIENLIEEIFDETKVFGEIIEENSEDE